MRGKSVPSMVHGSDHGWTGNFFFFWLGHQSGLGQVRGFKHWHGLLSFCWDGGQPLFPLNHLAFYHQNICCLHLLANILYKFPFLYPITPLTQLHYLLLWFKYWSLTTYILFRGFWYPNSYSRCCYSICFSLNAPVLIELCCHKSS